jgi:hypothetical protein
MDDGKIYHCLPAVLSLVAPQSEVGSSQAKAGAKVACLIAMINEQTCPPTPHTCGIGGTALCGFEGWIASRNEPSRGWLVQSHWLLLTYC